MYTVGPKVGGEGVGEWGGGGEGEGESLHSMHSKNVFAHN